MYETDIEKLVNSFKNIEKLYAENKIEEVKSLIKNYLEFLPTDSETLTTLGVILFEQKLYEESIPLFENALKIDSKNPVYLTNLGASLKEIGKLDEAIVLFNNALKIDPNLFSALYNLANTYQKLGSFVLSEKWYCYAININPLFAPSYNNLGTLYKDRGKLDLAITCFLRAIECDPTNAIIFSNYLFCLNYLFIDKELCFKEHKKYSSYSKYIPSFFPITSLYKKQLNVGYVSPDFRKHSIAHFMYPILHGHSYKVKVFCYSDTKKEDAVTDELKKVSDYWRNTSLMSNEVLYTLIKSDKIDILVDLAGHSGDNRMVLFSMKPAKIQISYLGYPNTTGLKEINYKITEEVIDDSDKYYTEKLVRMTNMLCYNPLFKTPDISELPCLKNKFLTFGSFNNRVKINDKVINTWSKLLKNTPDSKLILKSSLKTDKHSRLQLLLKFIEQGVDSSRITILPYLSIYEHLESYNLIDISLDTFPYNGTTTTIESLWMGVPVIALKGDRHCSRMGESILYKVGMTEWVMSSINEYKIPVSIEEVGYLRTTLRNRILNSCLVNEKLFIKELEQIYFKMYNGEENCEL